jgi:hypothetical protein
VTGRLFRGLIMCGECHTEKAQTSISGYSDT